MNTRRFFVTAVAVTALTFSIRSASAQAPIRGHLETTQIDSGIKNNAQVSPTVVYEDVIDFGEATWCWVRFSDLNLPAGSFVRVTSLQDNESQTLDAAGVAMWNGRSARFNGAQLKVELIAGANTNGNRLKIAESMVSDILFDDGSPRSICSGTDDRVLSTNNAVGRLISNVGLCTAWIAETNSGGPDRCFITAGHCAQGMTSGSVEFNVPASLANCATVAPSVLNQFPVDPASIQFEQAGVGADWGVFRCFPNNNGETAYQRYGLAIPLATSVANGAAVKQVGYGSDGGNTCSCANPNGVRDSVQQEATGTLSGVTASAIGHNCDTCGGTSGGPVIRTSDNRAVGINTHGAPGENCPGAGVNSGTNILQSNLAAAILTCAGTLPVNDAVPAMSREGMFIMMGLMAIAGVLIVLRGRQAVA